MILFSSIAGISKDLRETYQSSSINKTRCNDVLLLYSINVGGSIH